MLRALAPNFAVAALISVGGAIVYSLGAPAWVVVYVVPLLITLSVLPAYDRWDREHYPDS